MVMVSILKLVHCINFFNQEKSITGLQLPITFSIGNRQPYMPHSGSVTSLKAFLSISQQPLSQGLGISEILDSKD